MKKETFKIFWIMYTMVISFLTLVELLIATLFIGGNWWILPTAYIVIYVVLAIIIAKELVDEQTSNKN